MLGIVGLGKAFHATFLVRVTAMPLQENEVQARVMRRLSLAPRRAAAVLLAAAVAVHAGCGSSNPTAPSPNPGPQLPAGFRLDGNPESPAGATWGYLASADGVAYDLRGILLKPAGNGPFGAVIISHGFGGNAQGISSGLAREMVSWGLVCIATNYTHAGSVPLGSPGGPGDLGASAANVLRARKLVDILRGLGYVDGNRVAAHGHSMGAFVTTALAGAHPGSIRVASHTAGGVATGLGEAAAPTPLQVLGLRAPYQMHHGDRDIVVPLAADERLADVLAAQGAVHELVVYPGVGHTDIAQSRTMLDRVRAWYAAHGMF